MLASTPSQHLESDFRPSRNPTNESTFRNRALARLGTQLFPWPGSGGSDSSCWVDRSSGSVANEFWISDRQWALLEPLIPMNR